MKNPNAAPLRRTANENDIRDLGDGTSLVSLPENAFAHVDNASIEDLRLRGLTGRWYASRTGNRAYVAMWLPSQSGQPGITTVARLITKAGPDQVVRYRNTDRFDLRRCNLLVVPKVLGRAERDLAAQAAAYFPGDQDGAAAWLAKEIDRRTEQIRLTRHTRIAASMIQFAGL